MKIVRHNAWAEIVGAPKWFLDYLVRHLAVPVLPVTKEGGRFGKIFWYQGQPWGSLVTLSGPKVPSGLVPHVRYLAKYYKLFADYQDARERPPEAIPWWSVTAPWRPYQNRVHESAIRSDTGVIDALPRSGKTLMAARLIDTLAQPTLYLAPSVQIVRQTHEVMAHHFGRDFVGRFDGDAAIEDRDLDRPVVIATPNSAVRLPKAFFDTRKMLIIDEFHHGAADLYHRISALAENAYYRFGFTGTHFRTGDDTLAMEAICSSLIAKVGLAELVPNYLATPRVFFRHVKGKIDAPDFETAYDEGIVNYERRNELIASTVASMQQRGIPTIVLTRRRAHADALGQRISGSVVVKGGENILTSKSVRDFLDGRYEVMIGTSVIGEGVDVPRAAALVYASGGNDSVTMMQSYYRPLTAYKGKDAGRIYDFWDLQHPTLRRQSSNRFGMAERQFGPERVFRTE